MSVKHLLCKRCFREQAIAFSSSIHLALQTVSLVIKTVYQNGICVLSASFRKNYCFTEAPSANRSLSLGRKITILACTPNPSGLETTGTGNRHFSLGACILPTSLPLPSATYVTATVATWTIIYRFFLNSRLFFVYLQMVHSPPLTCSTGTHAQLFSLHLMSPSLRPPPALWLPICEVLSAP